MSENKTEKVINIDVGQKPVVMASSDQKALTNEIQLGKEDMDSLSEKIRTEEASMRQVAEMQLTLTRMNAQMGAAVQAAEAARDDRNKFCMEVEQKYKVPKGASWVLNFEKGAIVIRKPAIGPTGLQG